MEDVPEDLVIEILSHLPFKVAAQYQCLNKKLQALISNHVFSMKQATHLSRRSTVLIRSPDVTPNLFYSIPLYPPHEATIIPTNCLSPRAPTVQILASCNGLLLLHLPRAKLYSVCNPVTGDYQTIQCPNSLFNGHAGLAIDSRNVLSPQPQCIVLIRAKESQPLRLQYKFNVFSQGSWRKSNTSLAYEHSEFVSGNAICLNGCLHWLRVDGSVIAFDVGEEKSRLIKKPPSFQLGDNKWLGIADGMITMISASREEIVVCALIDDRKESWKITAKIGNIASKENTYHGGFPISFDGLQLLMLYQVEKMDGKIYKYDIYSKLWAHIGTVRNMQDPSQIFFPFLPTLAKVSIAQSGLKIPICLPELRRLLKRSIEV